MKLFSLKELQILFSQPLPGESAHLAFSPIRMKSSEALKTATLIRQSAVAIILYHQDDELYTLIIKRQEYNGNHSGQLSFPGGKSEENDKSLIHTALRECQEEIGISETELVHLEELTNVYIPVSGFHIEPHVFYWENPQTDFTISEREVATVIPVKLTELFDDNCIELRDISFPNGQVVTDLPHFCVGNHAIWGATALMINEMKELFSTFISSK